MMNKIIVGIIAIGAVLGSLAFFGLSPFGKTLVKEMFGSPSGTTFNGIPAAMITFSLANSTSTAILNPSGQMAIVKTDEVACQNVGTSLTAYTGTGLASLTLSIGTSTTPLVSPTSPTTVFPNPVGILTIATSTANFLLASSTMQTASSSAIQWAAGTFMNFETNATNTATCTVGVSYLGT